ncbi:MAG: hypothetical protein FJZ57_07730, partial [Chlamydiae bacterium]|nr:hypothetical protein [Chlamydiota bacterium]
MTNKSFITDDPVSFLVTSASKNGKTQEKNSFTVVKRNGSMVPFRRDRIYNALEAAFRDTKKIEKTVTLDSELTKTIDEVTDIVVEELISLASKG